LERPRSSDLQPSVTTSVSNSAQILGTLIVDASGSRKRIALAQRHNAELGLTNPDRVRKHRLKHRLQFTWRAGDNLEHLRRRRLLLQCLGKLARARLHLVEQPHILDRDRRLVGKSFEKSDLLVREGSDLASIDVDDAQQLLALEYRDTERGPKRLHMHATV
jgi:hypothetical protein